MTPTRDHGLRFGTLDLVGRGSPFAEVKALGSTSGTSWGSPQPITSGLRTLAQDGSVVVTQGHDNRDIVIGLALRGVDGMALAEAEARLAAEINAANTFGVRNTLTWVPPHNGPATVFDVLAAALTHEFDDLLEQMHGERVFALELICHPFARSSTPFTVEALEVPGTPTSTVVSDGSSVAGWTGKGAISVFADQIRVDAVATAPNWLEFSDAADLTQMPSEPYVSAKVAVPFGYANAAVTLTVDGVGQELVSATQGSVQGGVLYRTFTWLTTAAETGAPSRVRISADMPAFMLVDDLRTSNVESGGATPRQRLRSFTVPGTARTEGTMRVSHDTAALGQTMVYTWTDPAETGWTPTLSPHYVSGGAVAASPPTQVGPTAYLLNTPAAFEVPVRMPSGAGALLARLFASTPGEREVAWSTQLVVGGTPVGPVRSGVALVDLDVDARIYPLAAGIVLPDLPDSSTAVLRITLGGSQVRFDDAWLVNTDAGDVTLVDCGEGTPAAGGPARTLWIDAATVQRPSPRVMVGVEDDRSDAYVPGPDAITVLGSHRFPPGRVSVLTVTGGADNAGTWLSGERRWYGHAGPVTDSPSSSPSGS